MNLRTLIAFIVENLLFLPGGHDRIGLRPEASVQKRFDKDKRDPAERKKIRRTPWGAPCALLVCGFEIPHSLPQVHRLRESDKSPGWERFALFREKNHYK